MLIKNDNNKRSDSLAQEQKIQKFQSDLQKKTEELAIAQKDRVRFKELSENYM